MIFELRVQNELHLIIANSEVEAISTAQELNLLAEDYTLKRIE